MKHIKIDGMLSGTGIRDAVNGGYIHPDEIGASIGLQNRISNWLKHYRNEHYNGYKNISKVEGLDQEGIKICKMLKLERPDINIEYFSDSKFRTLPLD